MRTPLPLRINVTREEVSFQVSKANQRDKRRSVIPSERSESRNPRISPVPARMLIQAKTKKSSSRFTLHQDLKPLSACHSAAQRRNLLHLFCRDIRALARTAPPKGTALAVPWKKSKDLAASAAETNLTQNPNQLTSFREESSILTKIHDKEHRLAIAHTLPLPSVPLTPLHSTDTLSESPT
jgi:hypothetical protein